MQRLLLIISALFGLIAVPACATAAAPEPWVVSQRTGNAQVLHAGAQPVALTDNAVLTPGDIVITGANGRVMLTHARDYVVVAPSSRLLLPSEQRPNGFTWLVQQVGTVLYKVHHTGIPHFSVEAPMLAAVVKGTSFVVIVDQDRNAVQVTDGIVDVSAAVGGEHQLVQKGSTVFINHDNPRNLVAMAAGRVDISGSHDTGSAVTIAGSTQALLTPISTLTSGLAREVPDQTVSARHTTAAVQPGALPVATSVAPVGIATAATPAVTVASATVAVPAVLAVSTPTVSIAPISAPTVATPAVTISAATVAVPSVLTVTAPTVAIAPVSAPTLTAPAIAIGSATIAVPSVLTVSTPTVAIAPGAAPTVSAPVVAIPVLPKIVAGLLGR